MSQQEVWITKWALTEGIFKAKVEVSDDFPTIAQYHPPESVFPIYLHQKKSGKGDWFTSYADALKDGERRRDQKIASLEKQIKRLKEHQLV